MSDLIVPHGGLSEPVCCTVPEGEKDAFLTEAASLTNDKALMYQAPYYTEPDRRDAHVAARR